MTVGKLVKSSFLNCKHKAGRVNWKQGFLLSKARPNDIHQQCHTNLILPDSTNSLGPTVDRMLTAGIGYVGLGLDFSKGEGFFPLY